MSAAEPSGAMPVALSTMWAVQPRFERDLRAFMERATELGYDAIEVNHSMDAAQIGAILAADVLPVTAVHAPAPLERDAARGWNRNLNLASTDEGEREAAVRYTLRSVDAAAEAGASAVVVHLGAAGSRGITADRRLRDAYNRGDTDLEARAALVAEAHRERAERAPEHLEQARRSLAELVEYAEPKGIAIGLECRLWFHEIPLPEDAVDLLAPYPPHVAGYWHDVGHAEVLHRLGLVDLGAWFDLLGDRLIGTHLHDVAGIRDHRAPGNGDVDFAWLAERIPPSAARTLEIDQREPDEAVGGALEVLRAARAIEARS
ncbi:MAG: sugar phosphate isomerase/epimerase [Chloroflexi bacterium]|nr:sugar phosphate isomerase/epimerase [Chloroflexota bacterium]